MAEPLPVHALPVVTEHALVSCKPVISELEPLCIGEIIDEYDRYVPALVRRLGVPSYEVDDVAQEVFLAICLNLHQCRDRSRIKAWIAESASTKSVPTFVIATVSTR